MKLKFLVFKIILFLILTNMSLAEEKRSGVNFYTGMFDFSDDGKKSALYGIEHQNENLYRDTIFGRISPVTGAMITADSATYFYTDKKQLFNWFIKYYSKFYSRLVHSRRWQRFRPSNRI